MVDRKSEKFSKTFFVFFRFELCARGWSVHMQCCGCKTMILLWNNPPQLSTASSIINMTK